MVLDNETTYLEEAVYSLFRVDATDLISIKAQLSKAFSIQPSEIDKMAFWEFELFVKEMERLTKEEQEQQKKEFDKSGAKDAMKMAKPGYMQKMMQNQANMMPKMPNMNMQGMNSMAGGVSYQPAQFESFNANVGTAPSNENISLIMDVPLEVTVELGRTTKSISEILDFTPGTIIELDKIAGEPIDVLVNGKFVAKGEVVVIEESFGIRVTEIIK